MRELGEFALIERINRRRVQAPGVLLGPGDDAALVAAPDGRFVVTTDMLVQDRHFRLDWSSPADIGRKAIAQNAADVVAMGAAPSAFVVALGLPSDTPLEVVDGLADGMWAEAARAGASIAGGDLVRSREIVISVTAFGDLNGRAPVPRSGARVGDTVAVAGRLGWSAAGLAALTAGVDSAEFAEVLAAHRVPQPPYAAVLDVLPMNDPAPHPHDNAANPATPGPNSLTDVSDGLLADLGHIAESSGVAIDLDSAALRDPALEQIAAALDADAAQWILTGGEDHAFAGTWPAGRSLPAGWVPIGRVCAGHGVTVDGVPRAGSAGWESFGGADSASPGEPR
ncbi:thiamine-monophosphate kinase [Nocardia brasiliensis NBRC 14402]|uniref:thiamine-phosphate kinase n=1 Tax=Nocardia brasiliensis TaxID=37326 RepID=UPI00031C45BA|nr:thiamine-phosphate kinase [Nocardia brasiliensis]ASF12530.1 thiamine-phosphate kinase [Nocardia brasiliensis]GAJ79798.1 thiamine-monophosphate kinase [Nocardia brasiliensis NBRC 14402]SUB53527.1 Thiamine-monophosphate kinase [Nocardia brasiliensis]